MFDNLLVSLTRLLKSLHLHHIHLFFGEFFFLEPCIISPLFNPRSQYGVQMAGWAKGLNFCNYSSCQSMNSPCQTILISNLIFYHCKAQSIILSRLQKVYRTPIVMKEPSYFFSFFNRCLFPEGQKTSIISKQLQYKRESSEKYSYHFHVSLGLAVFLA